MAEAEAKAKAAAEKKLAEEESEYMLHATILKNCKKQEEEIHDEDNVFAGYVSEEAQTESALGKGLRTGTRMSRPPTTYFCSATLTSMVSRVYLRWQLEELKSASTTFSSKPNTRGQSRGRSRGVSRGQSREPYPTRGRSGSPLEA